MRERIARVDLATGAVQFEPLPALHRFEISFRPRNIRDPDESRAAQARSLSVGLCIVFQPRVRQQQSYRPSPRPPTRPLRLPPAARRGLGLCRRGPRADERPHGQPGPRPRAGRVGAAESAGGPRLIEHF